MSLAPLPDYPIGVDSMLIFIRDDVLDPNVPPLEFEELVESSSSGSEGLPAVEGEPMLKKRKVEPLATGKAG